MDASEVPLLPPVRLPSRAALAAAVRSSPLGSSLSGSASSDEVVEVVRRLAEAAVLEDDEEVLALWGAVCRVLLLPQELGEQAVTLTLLRLFFAREPLDGSSPSLLVRLGLVERVDGSYGLTGLGLWAGRELAKDLLGQDVPILGAFATSGSAAPSSAFGSPAADRGAGALLWALRAYPERERDEELAGWLAGRDAGEAAQEIGAALATTSPLGRAVGVELLATRLGSSGARVLEELLETPRVGSLVAARLGRTDREPVPEEVSWVLVDMAAGLLEYGGEVEQVIESVSMGMDPEELADTIAILAFGDHPATEPVLRMFAEHHDDTRVSAAARKALRRHHGLTSP
ncbi:hypothetical protein ACIBG8_10515 [Nonomuraea sp. NPDC050556]|uniref:hypothetical protein n=1 Tax=Nonomuraea sp. NPDC050556 TaxID=3364369 RepID=UPI0037A8BB40